MNMMPAIAWWSRPEREQAARKYPRRLTELLFPDFGNGRFFGYDLFLFCRGLWLHHDHIRPGRLVLVLGDNDLVPHLFLLGRRRGRYLACSVIVTALGAPPLL